MEGAVRHVLKKVRIENLADSPNDEPSKATHLLLIKATHKERL